MHHTRSAQYYDALYAAIGKDYAQEAEHLHALVQPYKRSHGNMLLDVACGTGAHIPFLQPFYQLAGLDLDPAMLAIARQRYADVPFYQADMVDFSLDQHFDVVACLFSSIGYVKTRSRLQQAIHTMSEHLVPGGLLMIEPWFTPDTFHPGYISAVFVDQPDLKIARMNVTTVEGTVSMLDFNYLVASTDGVDYFHERHELGLFTHQEYIAALEEQGLEVTHLADGLMGRGLYVGIKPTG